MKGDFHIHSTSSDGLLDLDSLLANYKQKRYNIIAITDHYVIGNCVRHDNILTLKKELYGIDIVVGMEQVAEVNGQWIHLLCYFNKNEDVTEPINQHIEGQKNFTRAINTKVKEVMYSKGINIPDIDYCAIDPTSYMPILCEVVKRTGQSHKETRKEFFTFMKDLKYDPIRKLNARELIDEVHKSNGLIVMAHPYDFKEETIHKTISLGIDGLEAIYPSYSKGQRNDLIDLAKKNNILWTAGSDFHNSFDVNKKHGAIGSVALEGEALERFIKALKG